MSTPVDGIEITAATAVDDELVAAFGRLIAEVRKAGAMKNDDVTLMKIEVLG